MSVVLDVRDLKKQHGARVLFDGARFSLSDGEKVGVIGRNGSGKSTLCRILAGTEGYEAGTIALRKNARVAYLAQDPELEPGRTVFEVVGDGRPEVQSVLSEYQEVTRALGQSPDPARMERLVERQSVLSSRLEEAGGWDWSHRVEAVLTRLGIDGWERSVGALSGGERRRVALARTLLSEPDLLLLDEPTNHLDADTVLWLEETLFDYAGAVLVVTHDRYFLDRVVDRMLEVSEGGLVSYDGGYTDYLEARAEREQREAVEEAKRARFLDKELAWARRSPPARTGKQKARRRRAAELADVQRSRDLSRTGEVELDLDTAPRLGKRVLQIEGLHKRYGDRVLVLDFSDQVLAGERIGIVGPNGAGKTTLLRMLIGDEAPDQGQVVPGEITRIGYFDQRRELDPALSVERAVSDSDWVEVGGKSIHLRAYLDRFLFPPHVQRQKVGSLSGGERNRVLLARLLLQDFNLLILDEPTNDLDLDTLRILEDALESFPGGLILVTHDRFLLDKLATSLWIFEGDGVVRRHHGSWDQYLARREEEQGREEARRRVESRRLKDQKAREAGAQSRRRRADQDRLSYREQRELDGMEARIEAMEVEKERLAAELADPEFYRGDPESVREVTARFAQVEQELEAVYGRWMELEERAP